MAIELVRKVASSTQGGELDIARASVTEPGIWTLGPSGGVIGSSKITSSQLLLGVDDFDSNGSFLQIARRSSGTKTAYIVAGIGVECGLEFLARDSGGSGFAVGSYASSGGWTIGPATALSVQHVIQSNSTSLSTCRIRNNEATTASNGTQALTIQKGSTTNTTAQVFVKFQLNAGGTDSGTITANGANAATFTATSDSRLKENIEDLPSQLDNIMALRPVEFDYKDGAGHQIGFIAQEMQTVYPDVVGENNDGMLTISGWSKTEARLVKALQELKTEFDAYVATHP